MSNNTSTRFTIFRRLLATQIIFWVITVCILFLGRLALLHWLTADSVKTDFATDITAVLLKGFQFDMKAASLFATLPFLCALCSLSHPTLLSRYQKIQPFFLALLTLLIAATTVGNWFYFQIYGHSFDVFVFGLIEEDTTAVLTTIWHEIPIISALLWLLPTIALATWLFHRIGKSHSHTSKPNIWQWTYTIILPLLLLTLGIRGSLSTFPLRQDSAQVSSSPQLNKLIPNAIIALDWARKAYANSSHFAEATDSDGIRLISTLTNHPTQHADLVQLTAHTDTNPILAAQRPNVVLTVMESMSSHLLQLHSPQRNLLGSLAQPFAEDWLFTRFISEGDGTSDTLHRLVIRSPYLNLSQSTAKQNTFISNLFTPYREAGYDVVYLTAGNGGWRDFANFFRHLGATEIVDENTLKQRYPEAATRASTWGVPDEYMFRYAEERLQQADKTGKPVFILLLSITNHPPYHLPEGYPRTQFSLSPEEQQRFSHLGDPKELNEILNTFRYSNDQLGHFIHNVKQHSPHTLIAATGDHNMRAIGYPEPAEIALGHGVPFYLYVPTAYRQQAVYRPERVGSHKDVMPTLYSLSLSNASYYQTGCNLTAPDIEANPWCGYGYNTELLILPQGFYHLDSNQFYPWQQPDRLLAANAATPPPNIAENTINRGRAYTEFLEWQTNRMAAPQHNKSKNP